MLIWIFYYSDLDYFGDGKCYLFLEYYYENLLPIFWGEINNKEEFYGI